MYIEMKNDFYFILLNKKELYFNRDAIHAMKIRELKINYVLYGIVGKVRLNLIDELEMTFNGITDGKVNIRGGEKYCTALKNQLKKKAKLYERINAYHLDLVTMNKNLQCACFSLSVDPNMMYSTEGNKKINNLNKSIKLFFNNIRSLAIIKENLLGYFWVSLLRANYNTDEGRYIHVNFYIKKGNINNLFIDKINDAWLDVLNSLNITGRILHFTLNKETRQHNHEASHVRNIPRFENNYRDREHRGIAHLGTVSRTSNDKVLYIYPDWNEEEYLNEHFGNNIKNKNRFHTYLFSLAKKSFSIPGCRDFSTGSIQVAKDKMKKEKMVKKALQRMNKI